MQSLVQGGTLFFVYLRSVSFNFLFCGHLNGSTSYLKTYFQALLILLENFIRELLSTRTGEGELGRDSPICFTLVGEWHLVPLGVFCNCHLTEEMCFTIYDTRGTYVCPRAQ